MTIEEVLERRYSSFINEKDDELFLSRVVDFGNCILSLPELQSVINNLQREKLKAYKNLENFATQAKKELLSAESDIRNIIKAKKLDSPEIKAWLNECFCAKKHIKNNPLSNNTLGSFRNDIFELVISAKKQCPKKDYFSHYLNDEYPNVRGNYFFSKSLELYFEEDKDIERKKSIENWRALDLIKKIAMAYKWAYDHNSMDSDAKIMTNLIGIKDLSETYGLFLDFEDGFRSKISTTFYDQKAVKAAAIKIYFLCCENLLKENTINDIPKCKENSGKLFVSTKNTNEFIEIGAASSQHCRMMKLFLEKFNQEMTVAHIFELIENRSSRVRRRISSTYIDKCGHIKFINNNIKHLQKNGKMKTLGLKMIYNKEQTTVRMVYS